MPPRELVSEFEARRVERTLRQAWPGLLHWGETLRVLSGTVDAGWVSVVWELADEKRTHVYAVEVRLDLRPSAKRAPREREAVELAYDFLASQFEEHLRGDRQPFTGPRWEEVAFGDHTLHVRGQILDPSRESAAEHLIDGAVAPPPAEEPK